MTGGALVLLVALFLFKWYEATLRLGGPDGLKIAGGNFNGWHAFTHSRWLWLIAAAIALVVVWLQFSDRKLDVGAPLGGVVAGLGGLSTIAILYRIFHHPLATGEASGHPTVHASEGLELGIWIALAAAVAITWGGILALRDELAPGEEDERVPSPGDASQDIGTPQESAETQPPAESFSGLLAGGAPDAPGAAPSTQGPAASPPGGDAGQGDPSGPGVGE